MAEEVAKVAGLERDERAVGDAKVHILRTIDKLNAWDRFAFLRQEASLRSVSEGDTSISMDANTYIPLALEWVDNNGDVKYKMERIDYETLSLRGRSEGETGRPTHYAVLNPHTDRVYYFWPEVDANTPTDYQLREVFYKRLDRPSGDSDIIQAPEEISGLIELGAQFRFARIKRPNHTALWSSLGREFREDLMRHTNADERDNPESYAWSFGPQATRGDLTFLEAFWRY